MRCGPTPRRQRNGRSAYTRRARSTRSGKPSGKAPVRGALARRSRLRARAPAAPSAATSRPIATGPLRPLGSETFLDFRLAVGTGFGGLAAVSATVAARGPAIAMGTSTLRSIAAPIGPLRLGLERLHRESETPALVAIDQLHLHPVALLDDVFGLLRATVAQLGNVEEGLGSGHDLDECAEDR